MHDIATNNFAFSKPTTRLRELLILSAIAENANISQNALAEKAGIVSSMANNYIKDFIKRGLITVTGQTNRDKAYSLTEKGHQLRNNLAIAYCIESTKTYLDVKNRFAARLCELAREGIRRVVLYGAAETGEIALNAAGRTPLRFVGVVDGDETKHGAEFGGFTVRPPSDIPLMQPDAVLIASFAHRDEIYDSIRHLESQGIAIRQL